MKKFRNVSLCLLLALSLTACGGKPISDGSAVTSEESQSSEETSQNEAQNPEKGLVDYTAVDPDSVVISAESDFVFEVYDDVVTHEKVAHVKDYVGTAAKVSVPFSLGGSTSVFIYANVFEGNDTMTYLYLPEQVTFQKATFKDCTALQEVYISGTNTTISREAFKNCSALRRVTLGEGVTTLEASAFRGCTLLTDITFPTTLTTLGGSCFANCESLQAVDLSQTQLKTLFRGAFENCTSLETVKLPEGWDIANWTDAFPGCPVLGQ